MKYPKGCKFDRMAFKGVPEWQSKPWLDTKMERLVSMTPWGMAVIPVAVEREDSDGFVPLEALKAAGQAVRSVTIPDAEIFCGDRARVGAQVFRRQEDDTVQFKDWKQALTHSTGRPQKTVKVTLNIDFLKRVADAMGATCLEMSLPVEMAGQHAWTVRSRIDLKADHTESNPAASPDAMGAVMPIIKN